MISRLPIFLLFLITTEVRINLDNRTSIVFPDAPDKTELAEHIVFTFSADNLIYNAGLTHLNKMEQPISDKAELEKFYDRFIQGALAAATNSKLISKKDFDVSKYWGKEITYTKSFSGIDNIKVVKRIFLVHKTMYHYEMWALDGSMDQKELEKFFGSIEVTE